MKTRIKATEKSSLSRATRARKVPPLSQAKHSAFPPSAGNQAVQRLLRTGVIQANLTVNQPGDRFEEEADRTAEEVLRMPALSSPPPIQRLCSECEEDLHRQVAVEEKDELLQAKEQPGHGPEAAPGLVSRIEALRSGGRPLPVSVRAFFEPRFGRDFSGVRVHTDAHAAQMAQALNAQAFTFGSDIVFDSSLYSPETLKGKRLLAHELTHVVQQGFVAEAGLEDRSYKARHDKQPTVETHPPQPSNRIVQRQGPPAAPARGLHSVQEASTIRIIEIVAGSTATGERGNLGPAVQAFRQRTGLGPHPVLDDATVEAMFAELVGQDRLEFALALVTDYYDVDISQASVVHVEFSLAVPIESRVDVGGLVEVAVGQHAFTTAAQLHQDLTHALQGARPIGAAGPTPHHLTPRQEEKAVRANQARLNDSRAIRVIQGLVQAATSGRLDADTVQRIADAQQEFGSVPSPDGIIDTTTLELFVATLAAIDSQNAAILLVVDYYDLTLHEGLIEIHYDPELRSKGLTEYHQLPGPSMIRIGSGAFESLAVLVRTLLHELEHVRQFAEVTPLEVSQGRGLADSNVREFLGEAVEMLSEGVPEEAFDSFMSDAKEAIDWWDKIADINDQLAIWDRFVAVREKFTYRYKRAGTVEKKKYQGLRTRYCTMPRPGQKHGGDYCKV